MNDTRSEPDTYFAPAARTPFAVLKALSERVLDDPIVTGVLESVASYAIVLDANRQGIAANEALLTLLGADGVDAILGKRPGEALNCVNASRGPAGCGTSLQCRHCGAVIAILAAQVNGHPVDGECTIASACNGSAKATSFRVRVSPVAIAGTSVYLGVLQDITASKRHQLLDQAFLHDLSNLVSGLLGWTGELVVGDDKEPVVRVQELAARIAEQLDEQRTLAQVERGAWQLQATPIDPEALAQTLQTWFGAHACARNRNLVIDIALQEGRLVTDGRLLTRVLGNLLKNALEATPEGETVNLTVSIGSEQARFDIYNPGSIPIDVATRLFNSPVTTKGAGHGIGLYSVQLFGEAYLGGSVSFESNADRGTHFRFELPTSRQAH
jgi:K+-sensing histidine kinase KdpD